MSQANILDRVAKAGFEQSEIELAARARAKNSIRQARTWDQPDANERAFWSLAAPYTLAEEIHAVRYVGYLTARPWMLLDLEERTMWRRIADAMNAARGQMPSASVAAD